MKSISLIFAALCLSCAIHTVAAHDVVPAPAAVRELPGEFNAAGDVYFAVSGATLPGLQTYLEDLPLGLKPGRRAQLEIRVGARKGVEAEEGYRLEVTPMRITVEARSESGAFYAVQTLLQLMRGDSAGNWRVPCVEIADAPRFGYRGVMLDVSRNFQSKEFVLKQIDAFAQFKLNRLHLHLTDGAGWRIEIAKYPRLTQFAAWRPYRNWLEWWNADRHYCEQSDPRAAGGFYTREDIRQIVAYARSRHIEVIPEIEMPGHSEEVLAAYPEFSCTGEPYGGSDLCAGNDATFRFLEDVLTEVMELFPSEYIHIGGDEATKSAWRTCPKCLARMKAEGLQDISGLQSYFIHRIEAFLNAHGRRLMGWDEILEGGLAPNATVMSWRGVDIRGRTKSTKCPK